MKILKATFSRMQIIKFILLFVWMGVIFYFSSQVAVESTRQSGAVLHVLRSHDIHVSMHFTRKTAHFLNYLVLGILFCNVLRDYKKTLRDIALWSIAGSALYALTDEFHQLFITGRSSQLLDVGIDTLGASLGVGLYLLVCSRLRRRDRLS